MKRGVRSERQRLWPREEWLIDAPFQSGPVLVETFSARIIYFLVNLYTNTTFYEKCHKNFY